MNFLFHHGELLVNSPTNIHLGFFGSPRILGPDGVPLAGRATQRHRLALLALLALAPGLRLSRDKLLAYLWPESDEDHGRTLLNQAVYVLRKALGETAILSTGDELQLNAAVAEVDVTEFEVARAAGDHARMIALYRGAFLDGFFLDDAAEFDQWVERVRERFAAQYAAALEALAEQAEGEQAFVLAAERWKGRSVLDPFDSRVTLRLMKALAASGNRAGALQEAATHQKLLESEYGLTPVPEIVVLTERLRSEPPAPALHKPRTLDSVAPQPDGDRRASAAVSVGGALGRVVPGRGRPSRTFLYGVTALALAAVGFAALTELPLGRETSASPSIAVLPLATPNPSDAALADAMTDELIATLAKIDGVRVIARTSVSGFRDTDLDVRAIADSLRVENLLEGSVQRNDSRLRVSLRLVDGRDGATRWSETYDRAFQDVFAVQGEIAESVAGELGVRLGATLASRPRRPPTQNVAAYEFYLRAIDPTLLRTDSGALKRLEYFQQAVALDSTFAAAYAGLASGYFRVPTDWADASFTRLQELAEQAALKALALDDSLAVAHLAYGWVRFREWDYATAEVQFERALALDPTLGFAHEALVELYLYTGRTGDALTQAERALEIEPLAPGRHAQLARAFLYDGRCDEVLAQLEKIAAVQPQLLRVAVIAAQCHALQGRWPEAISTMRAQGANPSLLGYFLARSGQRDEARAIRASIVERWRQSNQDAVDVAIVSAGLGELDDAFLWLDRAIEDRSITPLWGYGRVLEPIFEELHGDPRFEGVRERMGL